MEIDTPVTSLRTPRIIVSLSLRTSRSNRYTTIWYAEFNQQRRRGRRKRGLYPLSGDRHAYYLSTHSPNRCLFECTYFPNRYTTTWYAEFNQQRQRGRRRRGLHPLAEIDMPIVSTHLLPGSLSLEYSSTPRLSRRIRYVGEHEDKGEDENTMHTPDGDRHAYYL